MSIELSQLYLEYTGECAKNVTAFPAAGSNRRYFRLESAHFSCIGVEGTSVEENRAFIAMASHFRSKGLPVPKVYASTADKRCYLQEDLGDTLLFDRIAHGRETGDFTAEERMLLKKTICLLPLLQIKGAEGFDFSWCSPLPAFDRRSVFWDLNYFKYCFLKATGIDFLENKLEEDFEKMAEVLLEEEEVTTFMYRDFQSRNVMIRGGEPYFIDFQGGRRGPVYYDVASFLWQARAGFSSALREELLDDYLQVLQTFVPVDKSHFRRRFRHFILFRILQVLGAYGFRGYFERKAHFLQSVPLAIANLRDLLAQDFPEYPYLTGILRELTTLRKFKESPKSESLEVEVYSFSYKKGFPEDCSGNGGGFVFDCRAPHNPGKYECYKSLTGLDEPVIRFLEEKGEMTELLKHAYALVDASVERYLERGFTHLMVCFGCTGGQHRSVYAAQHMAEHIFQKFGVKVKLVHREQQLEKVFEKKEQSF